MEECSWIEVMMWMTEVDLRRNLKHGTKQAERYGGRFLQGLLVGLVRQIQPLFLQQKMAVIR